MLRAGSIRAVVSLPPGASHPFGVSLQLWVLQKPVAQNSGASVLLVDAADCRATSSILRAQAVDWDAVRERTAHHPFAKAYFTLVEELGIAQVPSAPPRRLSSVPRSA